MARGASLYGALLLGGYLSHEVPRVECNFVPRSGRGGSMFRVDRFNIEAPA